MKRSLVIVVAAAALAGCGASGSPTGPGGVKLKGYDPVMVTMTWTGGATGSPTDSKAVIPPTNTLPNPNRVCHPNVFRVTLYDSATRFNGLTIRNNCPSTIWFGACVFAGSGSGARPEGFQECAKDAMDTPYGRLYINGISGNGGDFYINAPRTSHSLVFFWCGDDAQLVGPGFPAVSTDKVRCIAGS